MIVLAPGSVDAATAAAQAESSHPTNSAWVSANAGSGKTTVLARRVIRLLLAGTDPARILCLTFTKAAAAQMVSRVFEILAGWTTSSDADLAVAIAELEGDVPDAAELVEARRLFARALDTPGGLKIQTIHAFCERLLHQFPFEANVAGHFDVLDERDAAVLADEARRAVLARANADPDGPLGRALAIVLSAASDYGHETAIAEFVAKRDRVHAWIVASGSLDKAIQDLRRTLGLRQGETTASLRTEVVAKAPLDAAEVRRLVDALRRSGGPKNEDAAARLEPYATSTDADRRVDAWLDFFMTNGGFRKSVVSAGVNEEWSGLDGILVAEIARLRALVDRISTAACFESSAAMLRLCNAAITEYDRLKQTRGVLDFEDLVVRTANLLSRVNASRWVHYKLDRGLDHILVDEAQDTSPRQWQVIRTLAEEFFAGEGAGETVRTLFAVGDEKQSIFSFQGAVPAWFSRVRRDLGGQARAAGRTWVDRELHLSFRSTPVVLSAVDEVFRAEAAHRGLTGEMQAPTHTAWRRNDPGRVVIWPMIEPPKRPEAKDWATPLDHLSDDSPEVQLANRIAATIAAWINEGETLEATGRPVRAGGILVLTRSRGALSDAINRALKTRGVPIAGADRLTLTDHIAVMDLMALGRVALLPEDDLSLAALLKSPLIGLGETALYDLAHGRRGSLWHSLATKATERTDLAAAKASLDRWRALADYRDPHAFFAGVLGPDGGRRAFLRRLGAEAEDVLDEFQAQALAYERVNTPSLEGFLHWLTTAEIEIKRDTELRRDEVRVMTVHGAKGLESDIVFLVDNGSMPVHPTHDPKVLPLTDDPDPAEPAPMVWMRSIKAMPASVERYVRSARERAREEYRRLLYVGMTRARDRLYVCGIAKRTTDRKLGWHALVAEALAPEATEIRATTGDVEALEWRARPAPAAGRSQPEAAGPTQIESPDWLSRAALPPPATPRHLTPSRALDAAIGGTDGDESYRLIVARREASAEAALVRGRLVHRLLQSLPDIAPPDREAVGARYLAAVSDKMPEADRAQLVAEVLAVLDDPAFAAVFAPGSRAEVEIAGSVEHASGPATVSGRIDRLAVAADEVLIVDYKTNRPAPDRLSEVPPDYIAQLALYRVVLRQLYPGRAVAAALLWTDRPALMEIPAVALDAAAAAVLGAGVPQARSA